MNFMDMITEVLMKKQINIIYFKVFVSTFLTRRKDRERIICTDLNLEYKRKPGKATVLCIEASQVSKKKKINP